MLEYLALGLLYKEPLSGYDIKKKIEFCFGSFCKASFGSLYPAMKRLTAAGLVSSEEKPEGGRRKIIYSISDNGKESFLSWLTTPSEVLDGESEMLAHIFFFDMLDSGAANELLLQYKKNNEEYLSELLTIYEQLKKRDCVEIYFRLSTLAFGISATRRTIGWCSLLLEKKPLDILIKED